MVNNMKNNIKQRAEEQFENKKIENNNLKLLEEEINDSKSNIYWFQDLGILTDIDKLGECLPHRNMTYAEKVNAIVRLSWYLGLLLSIVNTNYLYLYIPVITMIITFVLFSFRHDKAEEVKNNKDLSQPEKEKIIDDLDLKIKEAFKNPEFDKDGKCISPDIENPFMNAMPYDNRDRKPACDLQNNPLKMTEVDVLYDHGTYKDVNNVFDRNTGKRQFFTMPWTTYPNDQGGFADWLYKRPPTCKEGNGAQCVANQYVPLSRQNLITPARGFTPS